ncbi:YbhB/YbcL family Raf kinase inhibitor-like protein [Methylocapsa acidiphila]|uniref:YbhB/YbcL family Raf kinase inhibitor-like protein n=1 Tax=Methylocapsa acidiphila TaxID=133552 RepID=UPI00047E5CBB|nr:YbhB/YbcL family Raf kinase inhibitor-like protein [Methylocapsa acidiphila]
MRLSSSAFTDGGRIPRRFTCDGENFSPPLAWNDPPAGTRSFALLCDDPDAPSGTVHHWALFDIPAKRLALAEGEDRDATKDEFKRALNDFNRIGYGGPRPPHGHGPHRYRFKLFAVSLEHLPLGDSPSCRDVEREARNNALAEAGFIGVYER